jgi:translation initiation factor IF-2
MSKQRVYEVAKQLNMDPKALVALFQSIGVSDVRNHMSTVEPEAVERAKRNLDRHKPAEVVEERIRPTVVKRRARVAEGGEVPPPRPSAPGHTEAPVHAAPARAAEPVAIPAPPPSAPSHARVAPKPVPSRPGEAEAKPREVPPPPPSVKAAAPAAAPPEPTPAPQVAAPEAVVPAPKPSSPRAAPAAGPSAADAAPAAAAPAPAVAPAAEAAVAPAVTSASSAPSGPVEAPAPVVPPAPPSRRGAAGKAPQPEVVAPPPAPQPPTAVVAPEPPVATPAPAAPAPVKAEPPPAPVPVKPPPAATPASHGPRPREVTPVAAQRAPSAPAAPPDAPKRPSQPPKTGVEFWAGRPGVPMPQARAAVPPARRTTYDPRAGAVAPRPAPGGYAGPGGRPMGQGGGRPRPGMRPRPGQMQQRRGPVMSSTLEMASHKKVVKIEEQVSLQKIAAMMSLKATDVLLKLLSMGMPGVNINSTLDSETAKIIANEFGWSVEDVAVSEEDSLFAATEVEKDTGEEAEPRPPIVTVMGHVDHGKTTLLDKIRKAAVADGEAGGITQHVGAYRVETARGTIAFLDTPGHEAFTAMRARGASLTDIVILVVAADDGVMPQTREAINHAQAAKVPIVVAVNKIDKPGADTDRIMRDLATLGLQPEEWGGETMFAKVSAKTGQGVDELLERVLLQAEILELKARPRRRASGTVIEALLDRGRGPVARVMVQDGTLRTGDILLAGAVWGKVRAMTDELGRQVQEAGPATPVEVLGLNDVPSAGDPVHSVKDARTAEEIADNRKKRASKSLIPQDSRVSLEALTSRLAENEQLELKLIVKGDVQGSVEAVVNALTKLSNAKVKVTVVHAGVGGITEGDVNLGVASKALIVGFNARPAGKAAAHAESEGVEIRLYNIIYNAVDDIKSAMEALLPATKIEKALGRAEVRKVYSITKVGIVAGCMVTSGLVKRTAEARLVRDNVVIWAGRLSGLRRFKDDAREVPEGMECGISLEGYQDVKDNDIIESFEIEEVKSKLF